MAKSRMTQQTPVRFKVRRVQKNSISDVIVQQIIALISSGGVKAGERLPPERELCKKFGAGRSSVREALRCLSIMGILNAKVGEGTSVALDSSRFLERVLEWRLVTEQHDIEDLMEVRIALEGLGAACAAQRRSKEHLELLSDLLARMESSAGNSKRFAEYDLNFHLELARASENPLVMDLISVIRGQLERTIAKILLLRDEIPSSLKEHTAIFEAVQKGDPEAAREAIRVHLSAAVGRYRNVTGGLPEA